MNPEQLDYDSLLSDNTAAATSMQSTTSATHQLQLQQQLHHTESMADEETPNNPGMGDDDEDRDVDDDDDGGDEGDMGEGDEGDISMAEGV